jgi:hypothetical protein
MFGLPNTGLPNQAVARSKAAQRQMPAPVADGAPSWRDPDEA